MKLYFVHHRLQKEKLGRILPHKFTSFLYLCQPFFFGALLAKKMVHMEDFITEWFSCCLLWMATAAYFLVATHIFVIIFSNFSFLLNKVTFSFHSQMRKKKAKLNIKVFFYIYRNRHKTSSRYSFQSAVGKKYAKWSKYFSE